MSTLSRRDLFRLIAAGVAVPHLPVETGLTQEAPMSAGRYDLVLEQGADLVWPIRVEDNAGTLLDLTGFTSRAMVRESYDAAAPVLTLTTENGGVTVFDGSGTYNVEITVTNAASAALEDFSRGVWDWELVDTFGRVARVLQGFAYLSREATQ